MSHIGKKPIKIPNNVNVEIEGQQVKISGPKGQIIQELHPEIKTEIKEGEIFVLPAKNQIVLSKKVKALQGLFRSLLQNGIIGVSQGFEKKLEMIGIGYKAKVENNNLVLNVGFTHPLIITCPEGIDFSVEKNIITVSGIDKQKVGEVAAKIRKIKKDDPYKGKGIRYLGEKIRKKEGKKAVSLK